MKRILIPFALVVAVATTASFAAFDLSSLSTGETKKLQDEVTRFAKDLNLTPDQVAQMKPILGEQMSQFKELKSSGLSKTEKAAKFNEIRKSGYEEIKKVLSPEQLAKWDAEVAKAKSYLGAKIPK